MIHDEENLNTELPLFQYKRATDLTQQFLEKHRRHFVPLHWYGAVIGKTIFDSFALLSCAGPFGSAEHALEAVFADKAAKSGRQYIIWRMGACENNEPNIYPQSWMLEVLPVKPNEYVLSLLPSPVSQLDGLRAQYIQFDNALAELVEELLEFRSVDGLRWNATWGNSLRSEIPVFLFWGSPPEHEGADVDFYIGYRKRNYSGNGVEWEKDAYGNTWTKYVRLSAADWGDKLEIAPLLKHCADEVRRRGFGHAGTLETGVRQVRESLVFLKPHEEDDGKEESGEDGEDDSGG